jgi:hypothetical protein
MDSEALAVGSKVSAKNNPFWLTITEVLPMNCFACSFGSAGGYAGMFHRDELEPFK